MNRRSRQFAPFWTLGLLALALLVLVAATACGSGEPAPSAPPPATSTTVPIPRIGQPFRNGPFEITVTRVTTTDTVVVDPISRSGGIKDYRPEAGQFVLVWVTVKNVSTKPATLYGDMSVLTAGGFEYSATMLLLADRQGLAKAQQPGTIRTGFLSFDVPETVTAESIDTVEVQAVDLIDTNNPPTIVALR